MAACYFFLAAFFFAPPFFFADFLAPPFFFMAMVRSPELEWNTRSIPRWTVGWATARREAYGRFVMRPFSSARCSVFLVAVSVSDDLLLAFVTSDQQWRSARTRPQPRSDGVAQARETEIPDLDGRNHNR